MGTCFGCLYPLPQQQNCLWFAKLSKKKLNVYVSLLIANYPVRDAHTPITGIKPKCLNRKHSMLLAGADTPGKIQIHSSCLVGHLTKEELHAADLDQYRHYKHHVHDKMDWLAICTLMLGLGIVKEEIHILNYR